MSQNISTREDEHNSLSQKTLAETRRFFASRVLLLNESKIDIALLARWSESGGWWWWWCGLVGLLVARLLCWLAALSHFLSFGRPLARSLRRRLLGWIDSHGCREQKCSLFWHTLS